MSDQIYEGFAALGRGLEEIVKMASAASDGPVEVPRFGYRVTRVSRAVYALNLQMLRQLRDGSIGRAAPQEVSQAAPRESAAAEETPDGRPQLQIGDQGRNVRRLQRALRRAGQDIRIDGLFRQETWRALCSLQRSRGDAVAGLQQVVTEQAPHAPRPVEQRRRGASMARYGAPGHNRAHGR